jgi:hypothetical protein
MMSYSNWNVRAIASLDPEGADLLLAELLKEPEYAVDAVGTLVSLACKLEIRIGFGGKRDFEGIWNARNGGRLCDLNETRRSRYAAAIKDAIEALTEEGQRIGQSYEMQLRELAKGLAVIDGLHSQDIVLRIIIQPGRSHSWRTADALEMLVFDGIILSKAWMFQLLDEIVAGLSPHGFADDEFGPLFNLLRLLPFIDEPSAGIEKIREVLGGLRIRPYQTGGIATALGHCRFPDALSLLVELAVDQSHLHAIEASWIKAVAQLDHPDAREVLVNFVNPSATGFPFGSRLEREDILAARLRECADKHPEIQQRLFDFCPGQLDPVKRARLAGILRFMGTQQAALAGLNLIDDHLIPAIPYEIGQLIEEIFIEHVSDGDNSNSYRLVPRSANELRAQLFEMSKSDDRRKKSASSLLGQLELWRLEHGRPLDEPRSIAVLQQSSLPMVPVSRLRPEV